MSNLVMRSTEPDWTEMCLDGGPGWDITPAPANGSGETGKVLLH